MRRVKWLQAKIAHQLQHQDETSQLLATLFGKFEWEDQETFSFEVIKCNVGQL